MRITIKAASSRAHLDERMVAPYKTVKEERFLVWKNRYLWLQRLNLADFKRLWHFLVPLPQPYHSCFALPVCPDT